VGFPRNIVRPGVDPHGRPAVKPGTVPGWRVGSVVVGARVVVGSGRVVVVGAGAVEVVAAAVVVGTNSRVRALSGAARKEAAPRSPPRAMTVGIAQRFLESAGFTSAGKYARR
jgi:hypothetical protein